MIKFSMLPAKDGDAILLRFGDPERRLLVDLGRAQTYPVTRELLEANGCAGGIDLLIVTHVDADHIGGALKLMSDKRLAPLVKAVWFNGYSQLLTALERLGLEALGPAQGERFSMAVKAAGSQWNEGFEDNVVAVSPEETAHQIALHGAGITILSPTFEKLATFQPMWKRAVIKAGLVDDESVRVFEDNEVEALGSPKLPNVKKLAETPDLFDKAPANGTSIAFVIEFEGKKVLCAADSHPDILQRALASLRKPGERLRLELLKVSHHGSHGNTTRSLLESIECHRFAFSTDGSNGHPDPETIAKILKYCCPGEPKTFYFNYNSPQTERWLDSDLMRDHNYNCVFPSDLPGYLTISV